MILSVRLLFIFVFIPHRYGRSESAFELDGRVPSIVNGTVVTPENRYSPVVRLEVYYNPKEFWHCGGSILDHHNILTAAHCLEDEIHHVDAIVGEFKRNDENGKRYRIDIYNVHKGFQSIGPDEAWWSVNDLCILSLVQEIEFNENVQAATLTAKPPNPDQKVLAYGFGVTETGDVSEELRVVNLTLAPFETCPKNVEDGSQFCTKPDGGKDTGQGDSGGPLIDEAEGTLLGLTSYETRIKGTTGENMTVGAYHSVHFYLNWIKENMCVPGSTDKPCTTTSTTTTSTTQRTTTTKAGDETPTPSSAESQRTPGVLVLYAIVFMQQML